MNAVLRNIISKISIVYKNENLTNVPDYFKNILSCIYFNKKFHIPDKYPLYQLSVVLTW